jgi:hypothetical protein
VIGRQWNVHDRQVTGLSVEDNGARIVTASIDGTVKALEVQI